MTNDDAVKAANQMWLDLRANVDKTATLSDAIRLLHVQTLARVGAHNGLIQQALESIDETLGRIDGTIDRK